MQVLGLLIFMVLSNKAYTHFFFKMIVLSAFAFGVCSFFVSPLLAAKLSKEECKALSDQLKELKKQPAVKNMAKGFEWVKANMKPEELGPIRTYLELDETLKFRCRYKGKRKAKKSVVKPETKKATVKSKQPPLPVKKKKPAPKKTKKSIKKQVKKTSNVSSGNFLEEFFNSALPPEPEKK